MPIIFIIVSLLTSLEVVNVSNSSMYPAIEDESRIIIQQGKSMQAFGKDLIFKQFRVKYNCIYVVKVLDRNSRSSFLLKRCFGKPSDEIVFNDEFVQNGSTGKILNVSSDGMVAKIESETETIILNSNQYFFIGDNLRHSYDSRSFGPIISKYIVAKFISKTGL